MQLLNGATEKRKERDSLNWVDMKLKSSSSNSEVHSSNGVMAPLTGTYSVIHSILGIIGKVECSLYTIYHYRSIIVHDTYETKYLYR